MPFDTAMLDVMHNLVNVYTFTEFDAAGNRVYSTTPIVVQCVYEKNSRPGGASGQQRQYSNSNITYTIYAAPAEITSHDKIVMDDGNMTFVQSVEQFLDPLVGDPGLIVIQTGDQQ